MEFSDILIQFLDARDKLLESMSKPHGLFDKRLRAFQESKKELDAFFDDFSLNMVEDVQNATIKKKGKPE